MHRLQFSVQDEFIFFFTILCELHVCRCACMRMCVHEPLMYKRVNELLSWRKIVRDICHGNLDAVEIGICAVIANLSLSHTRILWGSYWASGSYGSGSTKVERTSLSLNFKLTTLKYFSKIIFRKYI